MILLTHRIPLNYHDFGNTFKKEIENFRFMKKVVCLVIDIIQKYIEKVFNYHNKLQGHFY